MLSLLSVLRRSKNFTSSGAIRMPPAVPLNHGPSSDNKTHKIEPGSYSIIPSCGIQATRACFEHSIFFKVNAPDPRQDTQLRASGGRRKAGAGTDGGTPVGGPSARSRDPTRSFLTAATLRYAIGAGITAAAGTRLALQWLLVKGFKVHSFQLQGLQRVLDCYFSSLPHRAGSG